ncbi:hypothetical protein BH23CHL8_BH23CHL8_13920 [soil metagenome]
MACGAATADPAGTHEVADAGSGTIGPDHLTDVGGLLYFSTPDPDPFDANGLVGTELWQSNGTTAGTRLVRDIHPGEGSSNPGELTAAGRTLYFIGTDGAHGFELWKRER